MKKERNLADYVLAVFEDRWVDWGVTAGFVLLIVSWFLPQAMADFAIDFVSVSILFAVAMRMGYVIGCVRMGRKLDKEAARTARLRSVISNGVFISFFVVALLLIVWRYLRA